MREKANNIVKDLVEKIFNLKEIFSKSEKEIKNIINETNNEIINEKNILFLISSSIPSFFHKRIIRFS